MRAVGPKNRNQKIKQYEQTVFQEVMIKLNVLFTNKIFKNEDLTMKYFFHIESLLKGL